METPNLDRRLKIDGTSDEWTYGGCRSELAALKAENERLRLDLKAARLALQNACKALHALIPAESAIDDGEIVWNQCHALAKELLLKEKADTRIENQEAGDADGR